MANGPNWITQGSGFDAASPLPGGEGVIIGPAEDVARERALADIQQLEMQARALAAPPAPASSFGGLPPAMAGQQGSPVVSSPELADYEAARPRVDPTQARAAPGSQLGIGQAAPMAPPQAAPAAPQRPITLTTVQPGAIPRDAAEDYARFAGRYMGQTQQRAEQQASYLKRQAQQVKAWREAAKADAQRAGGISEETRQQYMRAARQVEQQRRQLEKAKVDPQRYARNMPMWAKALTVIGATLQGFAEVWSGGRVKQTVLPMLERAIDRDIAAQREQIKSLIQSTAMSERQQQRLWQQYRAAETDKKAHALRATSLLSAEAALQSDSVQVRQNAAQVIDAIQGRLVQLDAKSRPRVTKRQVLPKAAKGPELDKPTVRGLRKELKQYDTAGEVVRDLRQKLIKARGKYAQLGAGWLSDAAGKGLASDIKNDVKKLSLMNRKLLGDSGPITDKDIPTFDFISGSGQITKTATMLRRLSAFERSLNSARQRAVRYAFATPQQLAQSGAQGGQANTRQAAKARLLRDLRRQRK